MVGAPAQRHLEAGPRGQRAHEAHRLAGARELGGLIDVDLDEARQPVEPARGRGDSVRVDPGRAHRIAQHDAGIVAAQQHGGQVEPAAQRLAAERRGVEPGALLVGERDHRDRLRTAGGNDLERARHPERPVEAAAAPDAVEVRADPPPRRIVVRTRPQVAGRIALHQEPRAGGLALEPRAGRGVLLGPGQPERALGTDADVLEIAQTGSQALGRDHRRTVIERR